MFDLATVLRNRDTARTHLDNLFRMISAVENGDASYTPAVCDATCNAAANALEGAALDVTALREDVRKHFAERQRHPARSVLPAVVSPAGAM